MAGVLPDDPNAEPPTVPWGSFSTLPCWIHQARMLKRKRTGRPRKLFLFPRVVLYWSRHGGTFENAYKAIAEMYYGAIDPDMTPDDDKAIERYDAAVARVKRQAIRERKWAEEEERKERRGILG